MNRKLYTAAMEAVVMTAAVVTVPAGRALAQQYPSFAYSGYPRPAYGGGISRQRSDRAIFDRVRMDLDRAAGYPVSNSDRKRFDEALRDLFDFQNRFDHGSYDKGVLGHAIDRLQSVYRHNSLDPRDRAALGEDIRQLREYREFRARGEADFDGAYAYRR